MFYGTTADGVNDYVHLSRKLALNYLKEHDRPGYAFMTMPFMPQFRMTRRLKGLKEMQVIEGRSEEHSIGAVIRIENIAAAGRMVSAGGRGWEIMRCIPNCVLTGQAAGTAAALAIRGGTSLQGVNVEALQQNLADTRIMIHMDDSLRHNSEKKVERRRPSGRGQIATDSLSYPKH